MIDILDEHRLTIKAVFQRMIPNTLVWAFGSRITPNAKPYSDLDLVIVGEKAIPQRVYYQIKDALEESNVPFKVDLLDWYRINPKFRIIIQKNHVTF